MGDWGPGRGQSKCWGSEKEEPWAGQGGNREALPGVGLLFFLSSQSAKAAASHPGGVLV